MPLPLMCPASDFPSPDSLTLLLGCKLPLVLVDFGIQLHHTLPWAHSLE